MISTADRRRIQVALLDRSVRRLEQVFVTMVTAGEPAPEVEQVAREELARLPHDVHVWWQAPCECASAAPEGEPAKGPDFT